MIHARTLLAMAFMSLTAACGGYTDDIPLPPRAPPEPATVKPVKVTPRPLMGYERYDFGNIVVTVGPGVVASGGEDQNDRVRHSQIYNKPGIQAYGRRLQVLRQERERLLLKNALLQKRTDLAAADLQAQELLALKSRLAQLSAHQATVMSHTQVILEEHGALLALLGRAQSDKLAQTVRP